MSAIIMNYDIVPESAPFSAEQRAWLNGFLAGILKTLDAGQLQGQSSAALTAAATLLLPGTTAMGDATAAVVEAEHAAEVEDHPWHDPSLTCNERMILAEQRPLPLRMMAAMAQLDCGTCGYVCKTYAEAVANGSEKNLTLCSPGGNETAKLLRQLNKERMAPRPSVEDGVSKSHTEGSIAPSLGDSHVVPAPAALSTSQPQAGASVAGSHTPSPTEPVTARLISSIKLNRDGSAKDTRHVAIDLAGTQLKYCVGDALGVLPQNCDQLVKSVCDAAGLAVDLPVSDGSSTRSLGDALAKRCLRAINIELCERAQQRVGERRSGNGAAAHAGDLLARLAAFADSDECYQWDVYEFLNHFGPLGLTAADLVETLAPLRPRLYSIASSQSRYPDEVHLTVSRVEDVVRDSNRKGVASTMLADRVEPGSQLSVFVQPHHGFTIPADPNASMIMVGPGTGIAPFIAFLQQREANRAVGKNWLFFGDQKQAYDFLYEEQLTQWKSSGLLTRLDLAFSRDGREKIYIQQRMSENGAELYRWLERGSYFYVCGDAKRMARDVEQTLQEIIAQHGSLSPAAAKGLIRELKQSQRYVCDVY